mmetsp:Transcript_5759/g.18104  ORF Transcript_5759/g.18104 Transcript_5759/m.18104 type:complete len:455 (-) Transcript_5759:286-1650(-)|eukprot:CAMPEP_0174849754 /NCGR_PEP_ID=MMETSP1114-20130205/17249_1 /TAXON_ID=312471 /ORGANISM="Neobodo designis, Strain CCAP 1951/1" /LENGTH=454 /DNA_ID=CAMNT_0016084151 /DNA_START=1276 /DNA_END=2640 /DNA_ORIENTATION=-
MTIVHQLLSHSLGGRHGRRRAEGVAKHAARHGRAAAAEQMRAAAALVSAERGEGGGDADVGGDALVHVDQLREALHRELRDALAAAALTHRPFRRHVVERLAARRDVHRARADVVAEGHVGRQAVADDDALRGAHVAVAAERLRLLEEAEELRRGLAAHDVRLAAGAGLERGDERAAPWEVPAAGGRHLRVGVRGDEERLRVAGALVLLQRHGRDGERRRREHEIQTDDDGGDAEVLERDAAVRLVRPGPRRGRREQRLVPAPLDEADIVRRVLSEEALAVAVHPVVSLVQLLQLLAVREEAGRERVLQLRVEAVVAEHEDVAAVEFRPVRPRAAQRHLRRIGAREDLVLGHVVHADALELLHGVGARRGGVVRHEADLEAEVVAQVRDRLVDLRQRLLRLPDRAAAVEQRVARAVEDLAGAAGRRHGQRQALQRRRHDDRKARRGHAEHRGRL